MDKRLFPLHWFAHVHGALMAGWLPVFLTQTIFAANSRLNAHRRLGQLSVMLGVLIWISMGVISVVTLIADNPPVDHFLFDVLLMQLYPMTLFGLFFTWAFSVRKNSAAHKRLIFLATLVLLHAGIDRIAWLRIGISPFVHMDALLILLFIYDLVTIRRIHKITWIGALIFIIAQGTIILLWGSPAWHNFWFNLMNEFR